MKRSMNARLGVAAVAIFLTLCFESQATEKVVLDGSTGVMPLASAIAKAFQAKHPDVVFELGKGLGTKARFRALSERKIDVALASHGLRVDDLTKQGMVVHEVARIAVVFGVNDSVSVTSLSGQQVCEIYLGRITNWKELGGPDLEIAARTRPDSEVDTEVVRAGVPCLKDLKMPEQVKVMPKSGHMAKELSSVPGAIGMTSMTVVEQSKGRIKAVALDEAVPTAENVKRGSYALVRKSFFVTRVSPSPGVARFIEFTLSATGAEVITANGAVPIK